MRKEVAHITPTLEAAVANSGLNFTRVHSLYSIPLFLGLTPNPILHYPHL